MVLNRIRHARRGRGERGAVAIMVAALATILFVVAALVIDLGLARDTKGQSQNAADASALAAGNVLYQTDGTCLVFPCITKAVTAAKDYAQNNFGVPTSAWNSCSDPAPLSYVPLGETGSCISFDSLLEPSKVRVVVPIRTVNTGFGVLAGVNTIDVQTAARATLDPAEYIECGLCVLGTGVHSIGNGDTSVISLTGGAGIHINGSLAGQPNSDVTAPGGSITIEGTFGASDFDPAPTQGPRIEDPLAHVTFPNYASILPKNKTNPCGATGGTGIYGDYEVGNTTCNLLPGLYVFTGTLSLKNNSELRSPANGVTLLFTCGTPSNPRACNAAGEGGGIFDAKNGDVQIRKGYVGPYGNFADMIVMYDRTNTSVLTLQGNGDSVLKGDVYAMSSLLDANGNSCHTVDGGAIVVNDIYLNGNNSCLNITNADAAVYELPPDGLHLDQ